jgi:hypothetical protein
MSGKHFIGGLLLGAAIVHFGRTTTKNYEPGVDDQSNQLEREQNKAKLEEEKVKTHALYKWIDSTKASAGEKEFFKNAIAKMGYQEVVDVHTYVYKYLIPNKGSGKGVQDNPALQARLMAIAAKYKIFS